MVRHRISQQAFNNVLNSIATFIVTANRMLFYILGYFYFVKVFSSIVNTVITYLFEMFGFALVFKFLVESVFFRFRMTRTKLLVMFNSISMAILQPQILIIQDQDGLFINSVFKINLAIFMLILFYFELKRYYLINKCGLKRIYKNTLIQKLNDYLIPIFLVISYLSIAILIKPFPYGINNLNEHGIIFFIFVVQLISLIRDYLIGVSLSDKYLDIQKQIIKNSESVNGLQMFVCKKYYIPNFYTKEIILTKDYEYKNITKKEELLLGINKEKFFEVLRYDSF